MPTELAIETAIYEAKEQERREKQAKCIADLVASQQGPRNVPSGSNKGSDTRHGEGTTAGDDDNNFQEGSQFSKEWRAVKFSPEEVKHLLKQEPDCDRCKKLSIPCTGRETKLICGECATAKVVCSRKFNNTVRVLAERLKKSEVEVRDGYSHFIAPSTQKGKGRKGDGESAKAKAKAKKSEARGKNGMANGKGKEREKLPKIIIPAARVRKLNETQSERSDSAAPRDDDEEDELEMGVDVPETSKHQSQLSHSRVPQVTVETIGVSTPRSRRSDLQGPGVKDDFAGPVVAFSDDLKKPQMRSKILDGELLDLTKEWTDAKNLLMEARSEVQGPVNQRLEVESELSELAEERDEASHRAQGARETLQELRAAKLEAQHAENQAFEAESQVSELRRKAEALTKERDDAFKETQRLKYLLQDALGSRPFALDAPSDPWFAQDQGYGNEPSSRFPHSSLGAQSNTRNENRSNIALLTEALTTRIRMFEEEKNRREELESEVACLRSELDKANRYPHILSKYEEFAREVWVTAYALKAIEASVSDKTDFQCEKFCAMIRSLFEASMSAKERIRTTKRGKFKIVGFIPEDTHYDGSWSSSPTQENRGKKGKAGDNGGMESPSLVKIGDRHH